MLRGIERTDTARAVLLRRLLAVSMDDSDTGVLRAAASAAPPAATDAPRAAPEIPGYRVVAPLGRGGMASVYAATRLVQGVPQAVALKVLETRIEDPRARERFVREQRILASLRHKNIAALIDAGEVDGRPWIAMERIDGRPIDAVFAPRAASLRAIVAAVADVADAAQAAHELLIVHRDIKPGNVLVDGSGTVKLIDFGIARVLAGEGSLLSGATDTGTVPLTLRYASPEQLRGEPVGVAGDVYQIGLLLFRLLTGAWPYPESEEQLPLLRTRPDAMPLRASDTVADRALRRRLRGDLDAVLETCLATRPAERYRSARDLQLDLLRYLESRPLQARRHSARHVARAFVRRHRIGVAFATAMLVALAVTAIAAIAEARRAQAYAAQTERLLEITVDVLNESDPYIAGSSTSATDASMHRIRTRVLEEDDADPRFRVRLIELLAAVLGRRGQGEDVLQLLREGHRLADSGELPEPLEASASLAYARALSAAARNDEAREVLREHAGALSRHAFAATESLHARIATQSGEPGVARARLEAAAERFESGAAPTPEERALYNELAIARGLDGDGEGSIAVARRAFEGFEPRTGKEIASWMTYAMNLAVAYGDARRYREADAQHELTSRWARDTLGPDHSQLAIAERSRAVGRLRVGRYAEALAILDAAEGPASRQKLPLHREAFLRTRGQAELYGGRPEAAVSSYLKAARIAADELRQLSGALLRTEEDLAWALFEIGAYPEAWTVARSLPQAPPGAGRRGAVIRVLAHTLGLHREPVDADRAAIAAGPCAGPDLAVLEAAFARRDARDVTMAPTCDGHAGMRVRALGGTWTPDWAGDFPLQAFDSPLVARLRAGDVAAHALSPELEVEWQAWLAASGTSD
jgi:serine/threonine protein kinase/tetratricopeptide (TPR) repeat protein